MYKRTILLGISVMAIGLFASCKMNAQNDNNKEQRKKRPTVEELFEHMDANEDGKLSKAKLKGPIKNDFTKIDTNKDGFLSKEEVEKAPKPKHRERGGN